MLKIAALSLFIPSVALAMIGGEPAPRDAVLTKRSVLLIFGDANRCTATLISPRLLLTAAHCLGSQARDYTAVFTNDLTPFLEGKERVPVRRVQEILIHPDFDRAELRDDVAIAVLAEDAPAEAAIAPLPEAEQLIGDGTNLLSLGYGLQNKEGMPLPMKPDPRGLPWEPVQLKQKKFVSSPFPENVQRFFNKDVNFHRLHVAQPEGGICGGDSGGPVYEIKEGSEPLFVGVNGAVLSEAGARCGSSALITRIDTALDWIKSVVATHAK